MTVPPGMVVLTNLQGLLFWRRDRIAMVREELQGRLEVLSAEGELAHRPGPLTDLEGWPFVQAAEGTLIHPDLAQEEGGALLLPGGWRIEGSLPARGPRPPAPDDPEVPGPGVRASEVLYLKTGKGSSFWETDRGRVPGHRRSSGKTLARLHPDLRPAGHSYFVNPARLRFLRRAARPTTYDLGFDNGTVVNLGLTGCRILATRLGLEHPEWVGGESQGQRELRRLGIRRWPVALNRAPADFLRRHFAGEPGLLVTNAALQTLEARRRGEATTDGDDHRGWYYNPGRPLLHRAGHLDFGAAAGDVAAREREAAASWLSPPRQDRRSMTYPRFGPDPPLDADAAWSLVCRIFTELVQTLYVYRDFGFRDPHPELRLLGPVHPDIVLLVEKESLFERARELHRLFGFTVFMTGGSPARLAVENLVADLARVGVREVRIASYCDHDVTGWDMPLILGDIFARYEVTTREVRRLITPEAFTEQELRDLAYSLETSDDPRYVPRLRRWVRETGGIGGLPLGISADHLQPFERLMEIVRVKLSDWLARSG